MLFPRRLLSSDSDDTCRSYADDDRADPISGSLTFHDLLKYISAGGLGLCCLCTFILLLGHIFRYRVPRLQRNIIRLIFTAPAFAILCFVGVMSYHTTDYMIAIAELYETFAFIAVFYLMIDLITFAPTWAEQHAFFADASHGGSAAFRKTYLMVLQMLPVRIVTVIATIVITAVHCDGSKAYKRDTTIVTVISTISIALGLVSALKFLKTWAATLRTRDSRIIGKLLCFKLIVFLQFVQRIVFRILGAAGALDGTRTLSWHDLNLGLQCAIITVEVALIGVAMLYFFSHGQFAKTGHLAGHAHRYSLLHRGHGHAHGHGHQPSDTALESGKLSPDEQRVEVPKKLSPLRAVANAANFLDVVKGVGRAVVLLRESRGRGRGRAAAGGFGREPASTVGRPPLYQQADAEQGRYYTPPPQQYGGGQQYGGQQQYEGYGR
jgi:hypothetical protein